MKKELLSKNKPEIENLKILSLSLLQNMRKLLKRTLKGVAGQPFDYRFMGLYEQKHCEFELKGTKMEQNEERLLDFLDLTGWDMELCGCEPALFFTNREKWPQRRFRGHRGHCCSFNKP